MGEPPKFHPALTVNNIRNFVPITLELENGKYSSWAELFKIHCTAFQVLDHIIPPTPSDNNSAASDKDSASSSGKDAAVTVADPVLFERLDAIVLQWIYGTISSDLLHTILQPNSSAASAWARLRSIFQDNKRSRAVYLESQFTQLRLENFSSVSAYCQELKLISDQLANVDAPVSEDRLVLQLISGLSEAYDTVATLLQQVSPLPSFYEARSRLIMEESRKARQAAQSPSPPTAMVSTDSVDSSPSKMGQGNSRPPADSTRPPQSNSRRGRARNQRGRGRGRSQAQFQSRPWAQHTPTWYTQPWPNVAQQQWAVPPCPYPATQGFLPPQPSNAHGILGPRPQHAMTAQYSSNFHPTDIEQAMHAMTLHAPDNQWYMDTGASSHVTSSAGHSNGDSASQM